MSVATDARPRPRAARSGQDATVAEQSPQLFGAGDVARLFGVTPGRLRYWSQTGFLSPSIRSDGRGLYTFRDLISIKVAVALLDAGVSLQRVRRSLDTLSLNLPDLDEPLARLRIRCDHDRVVVEEAAGVFDAETGQMLLDLEVSRLGDEVAQVLSLERAPSDEDPAGAYDHFLAGCEHEAQWNGADDCEHLAAAKECYERALELDPELAAAATNLGGLLADAGDLDGARDLFGRALDCDPNQPEARANLAELALRAKDYEVAVEGYRQVLRMAPDYYEAHYGLARALLELGGRVQALAHLRRFADAARRDGDTQDAELVRRIESAEAAARCLDPDPDVAR